MFSPLCPTRRIGGQVPRWDANADLFSLRPDGSREGRSSRRICTKRNGGTVRGYKLRRAGDATHTETHFSLPAWKMG